MPAVNNPISLAASVAPQLHALLRARIVSGDLEPGQRMSESEIAATYAVSRHPVREAFIKLAEEQLLSIRPQRGTFVRRISVVSALTARFIREAVEADLVRRVAKCASMEEVEELTAQIAEQNAAAEKGDPAAFMHLDEAFHRSLAQIAGVPEVSDYLEGLNVQMNRVRNISARQFPAGKLVEQHAAVVAAIRARDPATAEAAMRAHLRQINDDLPKVVAAHPDYFEDEEALDRI